MSENEYDVIMIGAGPGGASCAALLAKKGFKVLLLEGNNQIGGKAITFRKQGFAYELWPIAGSPVFGSRFEQLQQTLGMESGLTLTATEHMSVCYYLNSQGEYRTFQAPYPENITDPEVKAAKSQEAFFNLVNWLQIKENELGGLVQLLTEQAALTAEDISKLDEISYHDFLSRYSVPQPYYSLCAMISALYFAVPIDQVAASEYILTDRQTAGNSSGYFTKGGYGRLFELCVEKMCDLGGVVKLGKRVEKIIVENNQVKGAVTAEGTFRAPVVISNAGIQPTVLKLVGEEFFDASYVNRVKNLVPSLGCVGTRYYMDTVFLKEPNNVLFSDKSYLNTERVARLADGEIPEDMAICNVIPAGYDSDLAPKGKQCILSLIFCPADPAFEYKQPLRDRLDQCMERAWPGFLSHVESKEYYSPRDISNLSREQVLPGIGGECIGLGQIVGQCGKHKPNPAAPVTGLYYVGCDSAGHGLGTHQAIDSAFNVADIVDKHIQSHR